jgi:hypothetical protein
MLLPTTTDISLPILLGVIAGVAIPSVWLLLSGGVRKGASDSSDTDDDTVLKVAPAGILECVREISGSNAYLFCKDMADATGSFIYRVRLPIYGGAVIVGDPFVQRAILQGTDNYVLAVCQAACRMNHV